MFRECRLVKGQEKKYIMMPFELAVVGTEIKIKGETWIIDLVVSPIKILSEERQ